jgi:chromosome segregation ATPase
MAELYDAEGNLIEGALLPDEVKPVQEELATIKEELKQTKESLSRLSNKDMNFKKLRDMTEAEKEKLTATEMELKKRQESLEEEQRTWKEQVIESHKNDSLAVLAGDDEDLRKIILLNYDRIKDDATTKEQVAKKMKEAYLLSTEKAHSMNPLLATGGLPPSSSKKNEITPELKDLAKRFGVSKEDLTK